MRKFSGAQAIEHILQIDFAVIGQLDSGLEGIGQFLDSSGKCIVEIKEFDVELAKFLVELHEMLRSVNLLCDFRL